MAINGGVIGAFGPSLECFQRATGLSQGALGSSVLQNRLAKLAGTLVWAYYASFLQALQAEGLGDSVLLSPHLAMAVGLLLTAGSCAVIGFTSSGGVLQAMMLVSGFAYGFTDSAANLLILWLWHGQQRRQRTAVAAINAFFTIGAFVTPMLVAASLHYLSDAVAGPRSNPSRAAPAPAPPRVGT
jgi:sugar phosphate permease